MPSPVEAVIFDLGGVICPSPFEIFESYAVEHDLPPNSVSSYFQDGSARLPALETGKISSTEFFGWIADQIQAAQGVRLDAGEFGVAMQACLTPSADAVDLVRAVKRRHRTALLTNNVKDLAGVWQGALPAELFDVIVDSSAAGVRKPEPAAYQLTLNALHCPAERAVFIDDMDHNLGVPREMGIRVIRFDSVVQCRSELAAYGVALHN